MQNLLLLYLAMKIYITILKLLLIATILVSSAGQGYALRPMAGAAYPIDLGEGRKEGFEIIIQSGLGAGVGRHDEYTDDDYRQAGAEVVPTREEVWKRAHLVLKVKEPLNEGGINEFELMSREGMAEPEAGKLVIGVVGEIKPDEGRAALLPDGVSELIEFAKKINFSQNNKDLCDIFNMLFTYYHFAASREMTKSVLDTGCTALTLEAIVGEASSAALFNNPEWINSEGEPGRIVIPGIVKRYKEALGKTLPCLDPMSIVAGIEAVLDGVVYLDEDKVKIADGSLEIEEGWVDHVLDRYPDCPDMDALKDKTTLITGAGAAGLSALWQARRLKAKVVISDLKKNQQPLLRILSEEYGSNDVAICNSKDDVNKLLKNHDIVIIDGDDQELIKQAMIRSSLMVGAALNPAEEAPKTIIAKTIKDVCDNYPSIRRLMVDIAKDQGGNFVFVNSAGEVITDIKATYHHHPVKAGYKDIIYYLVGNMPGRPGVIAKASSKMLQAARLYYLKELMEFGLLQAANRDPGLKAGLSVVQGELTDERVATTKGFGFDWSPVDQALKSLDPTVADYMVKCLEAEGVEYVFGVPGEEVLYLMDALRRSKKIKFILATDERGAAFMADVYGRITRKPGVVLTTLGPGATNALTGIADAFKDRSPVVMIAGQSPTTAPSMQAHQLIDLERIYDSVTKYTGELRSAKGSAVKREVSEAFAKARALPRGPSLLVLPKDIGAKKTGEVVWGYRKRTASHPAKDANPEQIKGIAELIKGAECPVIIVGNVLLRAEKKAGAVMLSVFTEKHKIPVATTFMGKGTISPMSTTRLPPINSYDDATAQFIRKNADLVITIGYDTVECGSSAWNPNGDKTVVNINYFTAEEEETYRPKYQAIGNVKRTLLALSKQLGDYRTPGQAQEDGAQVTREHELLISKARTDNSYPMNPLRVIQAIRNVVKGKDVVVFDVGKHKMLGGWYYRVDRPSTAIVFNGFASMGGALPGAIGARLAAPKKDIVAICGDGGFMQSVNEIRTAFQYNIPMLTVVMEDGALGLIKQKQVEEFGSDAVFGVEFSPNLDLVKVAEGYGASAIRVNKPGDLNNVLRKAYRDARRLSKPHVVVIPVDYSDDLPKAAIDLLEKGKLTMPADNGQEFIYRFRSKEAEKSGCAEDLIMDIFIKEGSAEKMIGYAHAILFEGRDWDKWVSMRGALEENELISMPFPPAIFVSDDYKNSYRGIGRTAMSLMLQIAQLKKAYRFVLEEANRDANRIFYSGSGFVPYAAGGDYLEFILYPPYMRSKGTKFPLQGIREEGKPEYGTDLTSEAPAEAIADDLIGRKTRGDRFIYIISLEDGSVARVMRFADFEECIQNGSGNIVPRMWHGRVWWFQEQETKKITLNYALTRQLNAAA